MAVGRHAAEFVDRPLRACQYYAPGDRASRAVCELHAHRAGDRHRDRNPGAGLPADRLLYPRPAAAREAHPIHRTAVRERAVPRRAGVRLVLHHSGGAPVPVHIRHHGSDRGPADLRKLYLDRIDAAALERYHLRAAGRDLLAGAARHRQHQDAEPHAPLCDRDHYNRRRDHHADRRPIQPDAAGGADVPAVRAGDPALAIRACARHSNRREPTDEPGVAVAGERIYHDLRRHTKTREIRYCSLWAVRSRVSRSETELIVLSVLSTYFIAARYSRTTGHNSPVCALSSDARQTGFPALPFSYRDARKAFRHCSAVPFRSTISRTKSSTQSSVSQLVSRLTSESAICQPVVRTWHFYVLRTTDWRRANQVTHW